MNHRITTRTGLLGARTGLSLLFALLGACSTVPQAQYPASRDMDVVVVYDFGATPRSPVPLPQSDANLTILDLHVESPDALQSFVHGQRLLIPTPAAKSMQLHCRYRIWQRDDGNGHPQPFPPPLALFPKATAVHVQ